MISRNNFHIFIINKETTNNKQQTTMKKQLITEAEKRRMQVLAGIIKEDQEEPENSDLYMRLVKAYNDIVLGDYPEEERQKTKDILKGDYFNKFSKLYNIFPQNSDRNFNDLANLHDNLYQFNQQGELNDDYDNFLKKPKDELNKIYSKIYGMSIEDLEEGRN